MAFYTARVVLHDATEADYTDLAAAMQRQGFSRYVSADDGARYELLPGDFDLADHAGYLSRVDVLDRVRIATTAIGFKFSAFITESAGRIWCDLETWDEAKIAAEATKTAELDQRDAASAAKGKRNDKASAAKARTDRVRRNKAKSR